MKRPFLCLTLAGLLFGTAAGAEEDLSGTYVMFQQTTSVTELPVVKDVVAKLRTTTIVKLDHKGNRLSGGGKLCDMRIKNSSSMVKTEFPKAFKRALPPIRIDAKLDKKGSDLLFTQAPKTMVLGAKLKNRLKDKLPEEADDKRVFDHDKDGKPGVTVKISGFVSGFVYVVQRTTTSLSGKKVGSSFRGKVKFKNEQNVIDASNVMLNRSPHPKPDLSKSYFRMEKVADSISCTEAMRITQGF